MPGMAEEADGIGDVATVLQLIRLGEDGPQSLRPDEIVELVDRTDPMELWRGSTTLLQGWLRDCTQPEVLDTVVRRLRRLGRFPEETLAAVGEGLAAVTGAETATAWRPQRQQEPIPPVEIGAWLHVVWLVADLIDHANGKGRWRRPLSPPQASPPTRGRSPSPPNYWTKTRERGPTDSHLRVARSG